MALEKGFAYAILSMFVEMRAITIPHLHHEGVTGKTLFHEDEKVQPI